MSGVLTFVIICDNSEESVMREPKPPKDNQILHIKAHFNYNPESDDFIPCKELGVSFQKGDILHIVNQNDPNWWQVYRDADGESDECLAGLIPSLPFQQSREEARLASLDDASKKKKKKSKKQKNHEGKLYEDI